MSLLKFKRLVLKANLFGGSTLTSDIEFDDGCTVIVTDTNTQGKSSLINSLAVGLGFDDLVKGNVSALVKRTIKKDSKEHTILNAQIYLEVHNSKHEILSVKRDIQPELSKGMLVNFTPISEWNDNNAKEFYVGRDSYIGARGFHRLLSEFIGYPDIEVISQNDGLMKLYIEYVFAAIFIEQKRGWADIMANSPYYQVREPRKTTISEILGLDYIQDSLRRNSLKLELSKLKSKYLDGLDGLKAFVNGKHFSLKNVTEDIDSLVWNPKVFRSFGFEHISLEDLITEKTAKLLDMEMVPHQEADSSGLSRKMAEITENITALNSKVREVDNSIAIFKGAIRRYQQRAVALELDLEKNKEEHKIRKLFRRDEWSVGAHCPVCEHEIDETLLSQVKSFPTMSIEQNIKYIKDQLDLLKEMILIDEKQRDSAELEKKHLTSEIDLLMKRHFDIQRSLSGVIPSDFMAQARNIANLEQEIDSLSNLDSFVEISLSKIKVTFDDYHKKKEELEKISDFLSESDRKIIKKFEVTFKEFLTRLGYNSYEINAILIDESTLYPRVMPGTLEKKKHMRADFGSSASDWVRIITAYTLALHMSRNNSPKSIHPNFSIFDEPSQQNMDNEDHLKFYDIVHDVCKQGGQVIISETDKNHSVRDKAKYLGMKVIDFGKQYVLT
jgi:hypothetical protein